MLDYETNALFRSYEIHPDCFNPSMWSCGHSGMGASLAFSSKLKAVLVGDKLGTTVPIVSHEKPPTRHGLVLSPWGIACDESDAAGLIYVAEHEGTKIHVLKPDPRAGSVSVEGEPYVVPGAGKMTGLRLSADGSVLYACDSKKGCVHIIDTKAAAEAPAATGVEVS